MSRVSDAVRSWLVGSAGVLTGVVAIGLWPTLRLGGERAGIALAAGVAVAVGGAALGALPVLRQIAGASRSASQTTMGWAMALRSGGTLTGALAVALGSGLPRVPFLAWVGISYGALLVVETRWMLRWLRAGKS